MKKTFLLMTTMLVASCGHAEPELIIKVSESSSSETTKATSLKQTQTMSQAELIELLENDLKGFTLLDVRTPDEFAAGHISGAINISHDQILRNIGLLDKYKDSNLIVYCRSGRRASMVTGLLEQQAYLKDIYHLEGDMIGWQKARLPIE